MSITDAAMPLTATPQPDPLPDDPVIVKASAANVPPPHPHPDQLPDDLIVLKAMILELLATLHEREHDLQAAHDRIHLLLRRIYGPRTERVDPNQTLLFDLQTETSGQPAALTTSSEATAESAEPAKRKARPHGRRQLPKHLPHKPQHHILTEAQRICAACGQMRIDIGADKSEQLDYRPASLFVIEHFVHKYACPCCSKAAQPVSGQQSEDAEPSPSQTGQTEEPMETTPAPAAPQEPAQPAPAPVPSSTPAAGQQKSLAGVVISAAKPPMPIAKGLPAAGLLADLIVRKFVEHMPLYRLERSYERQGYFLPRSTLCDWLAACAKVLKPLYELMISIVLQSRVLHTDDTPIKIHDPPEGETDKGRMWDYLGDAAHPYNVFDFTPNRKRDGPQTFLANYRGYLQADAFSGYDALYLPKAKDGKPVIHEVACNAHARRKFFEATSSDAAHAHQALAYYRQLYEIERQATLLGADDELRLRMRQDLSVQILKKFHDWLVEEQPKVLPKSPMGEAFGYALNQWTALQRYTEAGFLAIDNNVAEREMKRIAIGRKNWLFVGSVKGGKTAAVLMSFTSTCHRLGVEPWAYLQDVLTRLPTMPADQLAELLPDRWQAARGPAANSPAVPADSAPSAEPGP
jgi:transposase